MAEDTVGVEVNVSFLHCKRVNGEIKKDVEEKLEHNEKKRRKCWVNPVTKTRKTEGEFETIFKKLEKDKIKFRKHFKMSYQKFIQLLEIVSPYIMKKNTTFRSAVTPKERLAVCLRYLATGDSFKSIATNYRLGLSTVHSIINDTSKGIWTALSPIVMPQPTTEMWNNTERGFREKWGFPNCLGVLDGRQIVVQTPKSYEKTFSIVLLALIDDNSKFVIVDVGDFDKISEGGTFSNSMLGKLLNSGILKLPEDKPLINKENTHPNTENTFLNIDNQIINKDFPICKSEIPLLNTENTLLSTENTLLSTENTLLSTENTLLSTENTLLNIDKEILNKNKIRKSENTLLNTENTLLNAENILLSTKSALLNTENTLFNIDKQILNKNKICKSENPLLNTENTLRNTENIPFNIDNQTLNKDMPICKVENSFFNTKNTLLNTGNTLLNRENILRNTENTILSIDNQSLNKEIPVCKLENPLINTENTFLNTDNTLLNAENTVLNIENTLNTENVLLNKEISISNTENLRHNTKNSLPHVFIGDNVFPLKKNLLRSYAKQQSESDISKKTFNSHLNHARKASDLAFGMMIQNYEFYQKKLQMKPDNVENLILATCCLHNFLRDELTEFDDVNMGLTQSVGALPHVGGNATNEAYYIRDQFKNYFSSLKITIEEHAK